MTVGNHATAEPLILDRLCAFLPQTRSVLMDRETLLAHRDRWDTEERPARSALTRLTEEEAALYAELVSDRLDTKMRLEQERIDRRGPRLGLLAYSETLLPGDSACCSRHLTAVRPSHIDHFALLPERLGRIGASRGRLEPSPTHGASPHTYDI